MMRLPFVSRDRFEDARADLREQREINRALVVQIMELKREGYRKAPAIAPSGPETIPPSARDLDDIARDGAKQEYIQRVMQELQAEHGLTATQAAQQAAQMAESIYFHEDT